jgi:hypothetical protein
MPDCVSSKTRAPSAKKGILQNFVAAKHSVLAIILCYFMTYESLLNFKNDFLIVYKTTVLRTLWMPSFVFHCMAVE